MRKVCKQGKQSIFSALFMFANKIIQVVFAEDLESALHYVNSQCRFCYDG